MQKGAPGGLRSRVLSSDTGREGVLNRNKNGKTLKRENIVSKFDKIFHEFAISVCATATRGELRPRIKKGLHPNYEGCTKHGARDKGNHTIICTLS